VALLALNILRGYDLSSPDPEEPCHRQIEAMKLAFADGHKYIADPAYMTVQPQQLLKDHYAAERRSLIGETALSPEPGAPPPGGTVYLAAADGEGNMVSFIQSNYTGFGSGLVVPGTGIALHNRGLGFSLDPGHDNALAPGKRPYHTIIPRFITKDGQPVGPFGVMGGYMQPQGHLQVVMNTLDFGQNPQAALDAPRWQWLEGKTVAVEENFPAEIAAALSRRGHDIRVAPEGIMFGRGQIIWRDPQTGVLAGGADGRANGQIACR
jgi:gamma-glutamyltranspeptidase/glutathione hydrolase